MSTAVSFYGSQFPSSSTYLPATMSPSEFVRFFPKWSVAADSACQSMASIMIHGQHCGSAIFVGKGIILAPLHLFLSPFSQPIRGHSLSALMDAVKVHYCQTDLQERICYNPTYLNVKGALEHHPEQDFCLLVADSGHCRHPAISYSYPSECVFAQINKNGELTLSLVQSCNAAFWDEGYCAYSPTDYGSSGGCYFDISGALVAVHLSSSTGKCDFQTGLEKKGILAKELLMQSDVLRQLQHICLEPQLLPLCSDLYPPVDSGFCYENEKSVVKGCLASGNHTCQYMEVRHGKQRSVQFIVRQNGVHMLTCQYHLRFQNGQFSQNIHESGVYSGEETAFYEQASRTFFGLYLQSKVTSNFAFDYRKKEFIGFKD